MTEHHDHRDDCPFKFATLDVCDCVEKNMLDRIEALTAKLATCEKYRDAYDEMGRIGTQAVRDLEDKLALMVFERDEVIKFERDEAWKRAAHAEKMWGEAEIKLAKAVEIGNKMAHSIEGNYYLPNIAGEWRKVAAEITSGVATTPYGLEGESHD